MIRFRRTVWALTALGILQVGTALCVDAARAQTERWWVLLPRSESVMVEQIEGLPYPPRPNERALARRTLRGRPDRVAVLERGPDPAMVREIVASGAQIHGISRWLSAVSVEADAASLALLRAGLGSRALRPVRSLRGERLMPAVDPTDASSLRRSVSPYDAGPSSPQLEEIQVDRLHARGFTGHGVRVLVLDTGFWLDHPAFEQLNVIAQYDFVFDDEITADQPPQDLLNQHRHGTGVLGTLAGFDEGELVGAAPFAEVLLAKTEWVATETRVEEDNFVRALEWGEALGADVMTASLGYRLFSSDPDSFAYAAEDLDGDTAVTTRAVDDLVALGVVAVTSAGNGGPAPQTLLTPADADSVLAVGAVDSLGVVAAFSSRGPTADGRAKPDLAARGRLTVWAETVGATYAAVNGTSLAAPLVSGSVALVLEAHPEWGPGEVMAALRATASQAEAVDNALGWGIVRAEDAIFDLAAPQTPLPLRLIEPGPGDSVTAPALDFRWTRALDLQTPFDVRYCIEFASDPSFSIIVAAFEAGTDTLRSLDFPPEGPSWWRVRAVDADGNVRLSRSQPVDIESTTSTAALASPSAWAATWPNPTTGASRFRLRLGRSHAAEVEIFDVAGRRVRTLASGMQWPRGERLLEWDGQDERGRSVASGAYLVRAVLRSPEGIEERITTRVVVVR